MPLVNGIGEESIHANIKKLIVEGYPRKQAVAIALQKAADAKKHKDCGVLLNPGINTFANKQTGKQFN